MEIGRLNSKITIQRRSDATNELGEHASGWTNVATDIWADVVKITGVQAIRTGLEMSVVRASIRIRYRTDITSKMRVVDGAEIYDIQAVMPNSAARDYTDLVCQIGASDG